MAFPPYQPHDRYFRGAFSLTKLMEEYVQEYLPEELSNQLDVQTLEQQKESYLDKNLEQYFSDVVYTIGYGSSKIKVTLLLEHKSFVPPHPWLQLLQYMVNAYSAQAEKKENGGRLMPVIPIVVYHGKQKWKVRSVADSFQGIDDLLVPFIPEFRYLLNDLNRFSPDELRGKEGKLVSHAFLALKFSEVKDEFERTRLVIKELLEARLHQDHFNFFYLTFVYLTRIGTSREAIMRTINQVESQGKEKVLSVYDQIMNEGMEKAAFMTFKRGMAMGLPLSALMDLTGIEEKKAQDWQLLLKENPDLDQPFLHS